MGAWVSAAGLVLTISCGVVGSASGLHIRSPGAPRACGVIELSEMFEGGLGERGTLAGDAQDEAGALVGS